MNEEIDGEDQPNVVGPDGSKAQKACGERAASFLPSKEDDG